MDFFKKQATSFLSSQDEPSSKGESKPDSKGESKPYSKGESKKPAGEDPGYSELLGSANVLLDAAKSQFGGSAEGTTKAPLDKAKLADAAEDVLQAASRYGKLEGTQYEGYVKKAEDYLQNYKSRDGADLTAPAEEFKKSAEEVKGSAPTKLHETEGEAPAPSKISHKVPPTKPTGEEEEEA